MTIYRYPYGSLEGLKDLTDRTGSELNAHASEFDSIVVRGVSGLLVGSPVALAIDKPLVIVRKPNEDCHDSREIVNAEALGTRYIFLDDFISSGTTLKACCEAIKDYAQEHKFVPPSRVASYLYENELAPRWVPIGNPAEAEWRALNTQPFLIGVSL